MVDSFVPTSYRFVLIFTRCNTFIPLQDRCPVSSMESVRALVEKDTGLPFESLFTDFEEIPAGAASLAQVHRATDVRTGQRVAVKIQHPELDDFTPIDLLLSRFTFRTIKRFFPEYDMTWLSDEMDFSLPQELDFVNEAKNARYAREYFSRIPNTPLIVPEGNLRSE